jgi:hypothetical protein
VAEEDRWTKLEQIVRRVVREEVAALAKVQKLKLGFENGRWVGVTQEQMEAWKAAYGMVDIEAELKRAAAWIVSNPHLAPKSQLGRFLNTWFAKGQDRASLRSIPTRDERIIPKKCCSYCDADAIGTVSGIHHCRAHITDAMDGKPRRVMLGVVAKPVAGRD